MLFCTRSYMCNKEERRNCFPGSVVGRHCIQKSICYLQDSNSKVSDKTHWDSLSCECPRHVLWTQTCPPSSLDLPFWRTSLVFRAVSPMSLLCPEIESQVASGSRNILQNLTNYVNPYLVCSELFQMTMHMIGCIAFVDYCFIICGIWHLRSSSVGAIFWTVPQFS